MHLFQGIGLRALGRPGYAHPYWGLDSLASNILFDLSSQVLP